jgi:gliding motility-associated-like protein
MVRLLVILNAFSFVLSAQNIVLNSSFECGLDRCDPNDFASDLSRYACDWSCPQRGTTDIFSTQIVNKACFCSMPYNGTDTNETSGHVGSQTPRTGKRFAGIYTYSLEPSKDTSYREYLQTRLIEPLIPGQTYCAKMYVSRAEHLKYAAGNLGMYFGPDEFNIGSYVGPLVVKPHVIEKNIVTETETWLRVAGAFQVSDTAQYLVIGNFFYNYQTGVTLQEGAVRRTENYNYAYYFIDDVSVEKIDIPTLAFAGSTSVCHGSSAIVKAVGEWDEVLWTTLSDTTAVVSESFYLNVAPEVTTSYYARARICEYTVRDTITITVFPKPTVDIGPDTTICHGSAIQLDAGVSHSKIRWNDESYERFLTVRNEGRYHVSVQNEFGCEENDEIDITLLDEPFVNLGNDTTVCKLFPLKGGTSGVDFLWCNGAKDSVIFPQTHGQYWITVRNQCGEATDTINIYSYMDIFIPNIVTPNQDGFNETFQVTGITPNILPILQVYNRWGSEVFSDPFYNGDWPRDSDRPQEDSYFYILRFPQCGVRKGWLQIKK